MTNHKTLLQHDLDKLNYLLLKQKITPDEYRKQLVGLEVMSAILNSVELEGGEDD
jgi:hypothetical protein